MRRTIGDLLEPFSLRFACAIAGHLWLIRSNGHRDCARCGACRESRRCDRAH